MGLDQYAFYARKEDAGNREAIGKALNRNEFQYWRKEYCIDTWMEKLYQKKGGKGGFNCKPVQVEESDLYDLEEALETKNFYLNDKYYGKGNIKKEAKQFIEHARSLIGDGFDVYYYNWW